MQRLDLILFKSPIHQGVNQNLVQFGKFTLKQSFKLSLDIFRVLLVSPCSSPRWLQESGVGGQCEMWGDTLFCIHTGALVGVLAGLTPIAHILKLQYKYAERYIYIVYCICYISFSIAWSVPSATLVIGPALAIAGTANILFQLNACLYLQWEMQVWKLNSMEWYWRVWVLPSQSTFTFLSFSLFSK